MIRPYAAKTLVVLGALAVFGCIGCNRDKLRRTTPIDPRVVAAVKLADSVEVYEVLDIHSAQGADYSRQAYYSGLHDEQRRPATGPTKELFFGDPSGTHLLVSPIGVLSEKHRRAASKLLLRPDSYTNDHWLCIPISRYVLRFSSPASEIYVTLTDDCINIVIRDASGGHLDGGSVSKTAVERWGRIIAGIQSGS